MFCVEFLNAWQAQKPTIMPTGNLAENERNKALLPAPVTSGYAKECSIPDSWGT
jgi:hypothetical protein